MRERKMTWTWSVVISVLIGSFFGVDGVWALCNNMEAACLERGSDVMSKFLNHPDENFRHCEVLLSIVECVEEFICTCNVSISTELDQLFTQTFYEYYTSCKNVTEHTVRTDSRLKCLAGSDVPVDAPDDPERDLEVGDTLERSELEELDQRLLAQCEDYAHCSRVYNTALSVAMSLTNHRQSLDSLCRANRFNLVCMSDAFCTCNEFDNDLIVKTMNSIRLTHEQTCQEQLSVPVLKCSGGAPSASAWLLVIGLAFLLSALVV